jgi:ribosomal protein RSM22 (predicted rRNA methylase)
MNLTDIKPFLLTQFKSEQDLIKSINLLSENFTSKRENIDDYHNDEKMISAYAAFYLTTNFPKFSHCMNYLDKYKDYLGDAEIIDIGVGPGTFLFAIGEYFNWKMDGTLYGIETSHLMKKQAIKIKEGLYSDKDIEIVSNESLIPPKIENKNRVIIFTHSFNEMGIKRAKEYINNLKPDAILFIEPGTKDLFQSYLSLRSELIEDGFNCHYPCLSNSVCPLEGKDDWCHQYLKITHDKEVERLTQVAKKNRKWMAVTLGLYIKGEVSNFTENDARIIRTFPESKFGFEWDICTKDNSILEVQTLKRNYSKSDAKDIAKKLAGDKIVFDIDKELKDNRTRIKLVKTDEGDFK